MPGTSGILSPFGKIKGLHFNDSREPDGYEFSVKKDLDRILKEEGYHRIEIEVDTADDYYRLIDELCNFNRTAITVSGTSKNPRLVIVETEEPENLDEPA